MVELLIPTASILVQALALDVFQSCVLDSPSTVDPVAPGEEEPGEATDDDGLAWAPLPPGTDPTVPPVEPEIIDTSPLQMIGCLFESGGQGEARLSFLFPDAIEGDGVIERANNHIWVFRDGDWVDVGPTPGPTIVESSILPPYNEIAEIICSASSRLEVARSLEQPLQEGILILGFQSKARIQGATNPVALTSSATVIVIVYAPILFLTGVPQGSGIPDLVDYTTRYTPSSGSISVGHAVRGEVGAAFVMHGDYSPAMLVSQAQFKKPVSLSYRTYSSNDISAIHTQQQGRLEVDVAGFGSYLIPGAVRSAPVHMVLLGGFRATVSGMSLHAGANLQSSITPGIICDLFSFDIFDPNRTNTNVTVGISEGRPLEWVYITQYALGSASVGNWIGHTVVVGSALESAVPGARALRLSGYSPSTAVNQELISNWGLRATPLNSGQQMFLHNGGVHIGAVFSSVPGYCKVGLFTGTGASSIFIDCGFECAFVQVISADGTTQGLYYIAAPEGLEPHGWLDYEGGDSYPSSVSAGQRTVVPEGSGFRINRITGGSLYDESNKAGTPYIYLAIGRRQVGGGVLLTEAANVEVSTLAPLNTRSPVDVTGASVLITAIPPVVVGDPRQIAATARVIIISSSPVVEASDTITPDRARVDVRVYVPRLRVGVDEGEFGILDLDEDDWLRLT
jgi:hypothetical protein